MQLYNTKSRKLEEFKPLSSREVKVYSCGPTVYNYAHIGNLRTFTFEDIVVRTLRFLGYDVKYIMNVTDVEDKTIKASMAAGEKLIDYTQKYTRFFLDDMDKLNLLRPDEVVPITTLMPEMVRMINTMLRRKNAYLGDDGSIYFDIKSFKDYGKFANLDMGNLKDGARVNSDEYDKESASDFVLWKAWKDTDGENFWLEKFEIDGKEVELKGRPGWHIECSACNMKYFGPQIDIHMGGIDLIFPHHQNEIAQTEACTKKEFSKYWLHSGHLMVDGKKMSKSLGNFYTLNDVVSRYESEDENLVYRAIRLSFMNAKYSSELDFTFDKVNSNISVIKSIDETLKLLNRSFEKAEDDIVISPEFRDRMQDYIQGFVDSLENNFNVPETLAIFHDFLSFINVYIKGSDTIYTAHLEALLDMLRTFNQVLAIIDFSIIEDSEEISEDILKKFEERNIAKKNKDFETADKIRDELLELGYKIIDDRTGSYLEKI